MKRIFMMVLLAIGSTSAFAQTGVKVDGTIVIGDLDNKIKITVGTHENERDSDRIDRLERAVEDLQRKLYRGGKVQRGGQWVCAVKSTSPLIGGVKTFLGKATTRIEAEMHARNKCLEEESLEMYCRGTAQCEQE